MIILNDYEFNKKEKKIFYSMLFMFGIIFSMLFYRNVFFSITIIPFSNRIKIFIKKEIIKRRKREYLEQFKDFLFMISTSIGTGRSIMNAIAETMPGLEEIYGKDGILLLELRKVYERMLIGGERDVDVLMDMGVKSGLEDVMDFVTIYSICKTTGASLIIALNKAASVIIDKMTIEREISELVMRKEKEGLIILIMPVVVILFLNLCAPDYIAPMYESVAGRILMTIIIATHVAIFGMIQKIITVEI